MNGFFNLDKPRGVSSAKAIYLLKKKFNIKDKIGHMGTLDPNATGVLIVGVGRANRLFDFMLRKTKTYVATFEFGYETETLDSESDVITKTSKKIPTVQEIESNLGKMIGKQLQTAPSYSAKNINGRRAYQIAREGKSVEIKPHEITIYSFKLLGQNSICSFNFEIECSGGTYIRSICRDFANSLGSVATMTALKRTKCGEFLIEGSKSVEQINEDDLISCDFVLKNLEEINICEEDIKRIRNGIKLKTSYPPKKYKVYDNGVLLGIATVDENGITTISTYLV